MRVTWYPASARSRADRMPLIPDPTTRAEPIFFSDMIALLFDLTGHFDQLIRLEPGHGLLFFDRSSCLVVESGLGFVGTGPEQRHEIDAVRACTRALTATDAEKAHVGHACQMIEQGVVRHLQ